MHLHRQQDIRLFFVSLFQPVKCLIAIAESGDCLSALRTGLLLAWPVHENQIRALFHTLEHNFPAIRGDVEVADIEFGREFC